MNLDTNIKKELAVNIMSYLDLRYLDSFEGRSDLGDGHYFEFMVNQFNDYIENISWTVSGVRYDGYGQKYEIDGDCEPEMKYLEDFLNTYYPDLYWKEKENIKKCGYEDFEESDHHDYYGSHSTQCIKKITWDSLINTISEMAHDADEEEINFKDLVIEHSNIVPSLTVESYKNLRLYKNLNQKINEDKIEEKNKLKL